MLFDHCAECQLCCRIDEGFPPLEITLNNAEKQNLGRLCITTTCEHLGAQGCTLGDDKPFGCQLYPLSYNPKTLDFFFDAACPLMPVYRQQLDDPNSEASHHLSRMASVIQQLSSDEPAYLRRNFRVDADYFDVQPLRPVQSKKRAKP
jgi:Fe-S-cluster containining protein